MICHIFVPVPKMDLRDANNKYFDPAVFNVKFWVKYETKYYTKKNLSFVPLKKKILAQGKKDSPTHKPP